MSEIPGKCIDRFIRAMYYEIPGNYDINNKMEIIHSINGVYYLGDNKFQGNKILVQNDSSTITILDQVTWLISTETVKPFIRRFKPPI